MAERRMFAKTIIDSDAFLEMPQSTQLLYFHLSMRADDDGFINKPKAIMHMTGCKDDDMKILITKKFIIPFESGVVVVKHWRIHNYIQNDRYSETKYKQEKAMLELDENKAYRLPNGAEIPCIQNVSNVEPQVRLGKDRLGKDNNTYSDYTSNPELLKALKDFESMRNKIKKPMTDRARSMMLTELNKLANTDEKKIAILEQSIFNNWKGVFPLKEDKPQQQKPSFNNHKNHEYDPQELKASLLKRTMQG